MAPMEVISLFLVKMYVAFAHHFVATHLPPTLTPYRSTSGIGYASYLKWREIQIAIQCTVDTMNYFE